MHCNYHLSCTTILCSSIVLYTVFHYYLIVSAEYLCIAILLSFPEVLILFTGQYVASCIDLMTDYSQEGIFVRLHYPTALPKQEVFHLILFNDIY